MHELRIPFSLRSFAFVRKFLVGLLKSANKRIRVVPIELDSCMEEDDSQADLFLFHQLAISKVPG